MENYGWWQPPPRGIDLSPLHSERRSVLVSFKTKYGYWCQVNINGRLWTKGKWRKCITLWDENHYFHHHLPSTIVLRTYTTTKHFILSANRLQYYFLFDIGKNIMREDMTWHDTIFSYFLSLFPISPSVHVKFSYVIIYFCDSFLCFHVIKMWHVDCDGGSCTKGICHTSHSGDDDDEGA